MIAERLAPESVRAVVTDPKVWPWVSEDGFHPDDYTPDPNGVYLKAGNGFMSFKPWTRGWWDVHIAMPRKSGRPDAEVLDCLRWMRENAGAVGFVARIPGENIAAYKLATRVGFMLAGRIRGCVTRGGVEMDMYILELRYGTRR